MPHTAVRAMRVCDVLGIMDGMVAENISNAFQQLGQWKRVMTQRRA